ncbi:hypothetical protein PIB30_093025 [Stylosanthes scabra]|uniref:Transposase (putative) gypsy type domain-containing protein n=1 Tax=Stylosanthes scabra TaxID=79078 RepID=A0ABU6VX15_9FABA|nr:hypothetical protein [Stylosanthes scabra]
MAVNRKTDENGKPVVPISADDCYSWVKGEVREMSSIFIDQESVDELGVPFTWVREGSGIKLWFLPCAGEDRVFHRGEGWEFFFMYTTMFLDIRLRFPFTEFECGVLSQLKCAPTQIHPNAWAFIRGFEILMEYLGTKPLLEVFFSFFQAKGVRKRETTTGGLKNYFKNRTERGFSASNVVKTEEGVVVNQPAEKKRVSSMKRRRAEEGGSGKKMINLTSSKCCGKEVSLEEVKGFAEKQKKLHGYIGEEDHTSVWSEHFPFYVFGGGALPIKI